ncbi:site-specific DNA-methyltransferase, partial [bacterium]
MNEIVNKIFNEDILKGIERIPDNYIDLIVADPPYCLGKDYGNDSDKKSPLEYLEWTKKWIDAVIPKLKDAGSFYIFLSWRYSPEIFTYMKTKLIMINEIIWDRRVPSMGGSTRKFSSVHDNIGFFVKTKKYYFDLDSVRIPYDPKTKKARTRSIFVGKKWLEIGYNPKDLWSVPRIHAQDPERENHPTQKPLEIIERIIKASCPDNGIVLDPFMGTGTTAAACIANNRKYIGFEINSKYCEMIDNRIEILREKLAFFSSDNRNRKEKKNTKNIEQFSFDFK